MKIFLASADLDEIRRAHDAGLIDGVYTSPAMLAAASPSSDGRELLSQICQAVTVPVCIAAEAVNANEIHHQGRELGRVSDHVIVNVPLVEEGVSVIRRLTSDGVRVGAMFVATTAQAILAAKAGAVLACVGLNELEEAGIDGVELVAEMRAAFAVHGAECEVIALHPGTPARFASCALAGVDGVVLAPEALRAMLVHPVTDRGIDRFMAELARRPRV
jgi:transaldolase